MSLKNYGSSDFATVPVRLTPVLPERLIHRNVDGSGCDQAFSDNRRHKVSIVDLPSKVISMTIGGLEPLQSTRRHRHNYETLIYVLAGCGKSILDGCEVLWQAGDAFYVPVWIWRQQYQPE